MFTQIQPGENDFVNFDKTIEKYNVKIDKKTAEFEDMEDDVMELAICKVLHWSCLVEEMHLKKKLAFKKALNLSNTMNSIIRCEDIDLKAHKDAFLDLMQKGCESKDPGICALSFNLMG